MSVIENVKKLISDKELNPKSIKEVINLESFLKKLQKCEKIYGKDYSKIDFEMQEALVLRRLQQLFNITMLNPAWKDYLNKNGCNTIFQSFEEWQNIPLSNKDTMSEFFMEERKGLIVPLEHGGFEIVASGGTSSGTPVEMVYSIKELHDTYKLAGKFMDEYVLKDYLPKEEPRWMITTLTDYQMWSSGTMVGGVLQNIPNVNYIGAGPINKEVYQHMMSYKGSKAIMAISSGIAALYELGLGMDQEARESFKLALYGSGLISQLKQNQLKQLYPNLNIMSYFAATQAETIGLQLTEKSYLATVPGLHFIEIVDENGKWVKEGEEGELVVTRLHGNEAPLLRLKIGDKVVKREKIDNENLKTYQFEFIGRSGDMIHLNDTQYSAQKVYNALSYTLKINNIFDLENLADDIQFVNDRKNKVLTLLVSADNCTDNFLTNNLLLEKLFIDSLTSSLSLFNKNEANAQTIKKTGYKFNIKFLEKGSNELYKTKVGKVPLIRDIL